MEIVTDTYQKAFALNMDNTTYGTLAEIGAGQEVSRWFFKVGGAAGTVAKTMSAYDMQFSDSIYGVSKRYVSRDRLNAMLHKEYDLLIQRLNEKRGESCTFFAFADTVATFSFSQQKSGHGWLGIRFQTQRRQAPSQIDLHVSLKGKSAAQDQKTLGILGVNLVYAATYLHHEPYQLIASLMDCLTTDMLEIDMIDFLGPAFTEVDNRLMALHLVKSGLTHAAIFGADGKLVQPSEMFYKKPVLVERSRFRPPTYFTMNLLDCALEALCEDPDIDCNKVLVISEMTLENLNEGDDINTGDFLERVDILCALGKNVMVSNYGEFYRMAQYLFRYTSMPVAIALGVPTLRRIFDESYYDDLEGGILEAFGRMFRNDMRLYVCPERNDQGEMVSIYDSIVERHLQHLMSHLIENGYIRSLDTIDHDYLDIHSDRVLQQIRDGNEAWQQQVPAEVVSMIRDRGLFSNGISQD